MYHLQQIQLVEDTATSGHTFLNFYLDFSHRQLTDFSLPPLYVTALANACSPNPLLPTPQSYHILLLIHFSIQLKTLKKSTIEKETPYTHTCNSFVITEITLFEMHAF